MCCQYGFSRLNSGRGRVTFRLWQFVDWHVLAIHVSLGKFVCFVGCMAAGNPEKLESGEPGIVAAFAVLDVAQLSRRPAYPFGHVAGVLRAFIAHRVLLEFGVLFGRESLFVRSLGILLGLPFPTRYVPIVVVRVVGVLPAASVMGMERMDTSYRMSLRLPRVRFLDVFLLLVGIVGCLRLTVDRFL